MVEISLLAFPEAVGKATALEGGSDRGDRQAVLKITLPSTADLMRVKLRVSREGSSFLKPAPV